MILSQQLITNSSKKLTQTAFVYLGREIKFKDFLESVSRLSYLYQNELGTGEGIRIGYLCRNCPAMAATFVAMTNCRAVNIPVDPDLPPNEIVQWLKDARATHLAVTTDLANKAREILHSENYTLPLIEIEKKRGGEYDSSFTAAPDQTPKDTDVILVLRSFGASGKPRLVNFTHKEVILAGISLRGHYHVTATDRFLTTLSWAHPFALTHSLFFPLLTNATSVIDHGLQALDFLNFLLESRVSRLIGTPSFFVKLLMTCKNEKRVLTGTKSITVGMGALSTEIKKAFDLLKINVAHCYGQVENGWTIAMQDTQNPDETAYTRGFVGKGLPGVKYKVLDSNGDEIVGKQARSGQLALTGSSVMKGYFENEKATKTALRGTWLYTGDYFRLEGEGETLAFTFLGRKEDILEVEGETVVFNKIDSILKSNPLVQDGAAFTVKDSKNNWVIACAIVRKPGYLLSEKQVIEFCTANLPSHLMPRAIAFTDFIPRDLGNNVICAKLRNQFSGIIG